MKEGAAAKREGVGIPRPIGLALMVTLMPFSSQFDVLLIAHWRKGYNLVTATQLVALQAVDS